MNRRTGTFEEFKDYTLAVARGERSVDPDEPKSWHELIEVAESAKSAPLGAEASDYRNSTLRERIVEHIFVGEALRQLWERGATDVEVLRSEFDAGGYDLVMSYGTIVRHVQFKSTTEGGKTAKVSVSLKLKEKPSGCVIWIVVSPKKLEFKSYLWFGGAPGEPLPDITGLKVAKAAKADAKGIKHEKPGHRIIPRGRFEPLAGLDRVLNKLFDLP